MIPSMQAVAVLVICLVLSIGGNAYQLHRAGKASAEHKAAMEQAVLQGQLDAKAAAASISAELAKDALADHATLVRDLETIAERGRQTRVVYRQAASAAPLPDGCAPGAARVDAVNKTLRGE